ncbi:MAG: hypothetical protein DRJ52_07900 [Thermoprotei archaeon]|nr:MAG: hypothetical protein DRJ52_07900 [Thermoprotei archaeon]RLE99721.1 MAG: hypothetical protein DRJ63_04480 [Thermoprotei archaeon]HDI75510.1 hypothetical protein [Thermoprotei archaeon]
MPSHYYSKIIWVFYALSAVLVALSLGGMFSLIEIALILASTALFYKKEKNIITVVNSVLLVVFIFFAVLEPPRSILVALAAFSTILFTTEASRVLLRYEFKTSPLLESKKHESLKEKLSGLLKLVFFSYILSIVALAAGFYLTIIPPKFTDATLAVALLVSLTYFMLPHSYRKRQKSNTLPERIKET